MLGLYSLLSVHPVENLKCYLGMPVSAVPEMLVDGRNEGAAFLKVSSSASY